MRLQTSVLAVSVAALALSGTLVARVPVPVPQWPTASGERLTGHGKGMAAIEPAYDDETGNPIYLATPINAPLPSNANGHAVAPLYIIVYPNTAASSVGTMNCAYDTGDNCPDHGGLMASVAESAEPTVYASGVWGHDHILDAPSGADFNVAWNVVVVVFTNTDAANTHITTEAQLTAAEQAGDARAVTMAELPSPPFPIVFNCSVVNGATYWRGVPMGPSLLLHP